jgi:hypothetical protein
VSLSRELKNGTFEREIKAMEGKNTKNPKKT